MTGALPAALLLGALARAHALEETSATVSVRDNHLEVRLDVDLLAWLEEVAGGDVPVEALAASNPDAFDARLMLARDQVATTQVMAAGAPVPLAAVRFPSADDARALAVEHLVARTVDPHVHGPRVPVVLEALLPLPADPLTITLHPSLGPTVVTFVEPVTTLAPAGSVTMRPSPPAPNAPDDRRLAALALLAVGVASGFGAGLALGSRRSPPHRPSRRTP